MLAVTVLVPMGLAIARDPTVIGIRAILGAIAATWLVATVGLVWLLHDPSDLFTFYLYFVVVVPAFAVPTAALVAARLVGARGQLLSAFMLGLVGWFVGVFMTLVIDEVGLATWPRYTWIYAELLAVPASYAALSALIASRLGRRTA